MLELLHLTRNVILSVTGAFPIAEGHHLILCWLSIAVGSCEGKGGEGRWEGGAHNVTELCIQGTETCKDCHTVHLGHTL